MQTVIFLVIILLVFLVAVILRRRKSGAPSGGNAANADPELESLYSLLGDNSGRMKK